MSKKQLVFLSLVVLSCTLLFLSIGIGIASAQQDVLKLDEDTSYVLNLETGSKQTYVDFLDSKQFEGDRLEFNIYVGKTGNPILLYIQIHLHHFWYHHYNHYLCYI